MLRVTLIRHFATQGNLEKKYIGITDEPLCEEGKLIFQNIELKILDKITPPKKKRGYYIYLNIHIYD